jgi:hypothetical protein
MVRKYWSTALTTSALVVIAVTFNTLGQTKIYQAAATLQFDPNPPRPLGGKVETVVDMGSGPVWDTREYYETQYQIIQSMHVALTVVSELGRIMTGISGQCPLERRPAAQCSGRGCGRALGGGQDRSDPGSRLAVEVEDADPARAQRILSTLVDTYVL